MQRHDRRHAPRPRAPSRAGWLCGAAAAGLLSAALILVALQRGSLIALLGVALLALALMLVGSKWAKPILLGLVALDLPLQIDVNLDYDQSAAKLGAFGGYNLSLTSVAVIGLLVLVTTSREPRTTTLLASQAAQAAGAGPVRSASRSACRRYALYFLIATVSIAVAHDGSLAKAWAFLLLQNLLLLYVLTRSISGLKDLHLFTGALLAGLAFEGAIGLYQAATGATSLFFLKLAPDASAGGSFSRVSGTLGSPNTAAAYLALMLPIALAVLLSNLSARLRLTAAVALLLGTAELLFTVSRGGTLSAGLGMLLVLLLLAKRKVLQLYTALVTVAVAAVVVVALSAPLLSRVHQDNGAAAGRIPLMRLAEKMITSHPLLGVGGNNFVVALPQYLTPDFDQAWLYVVHNDYLLVASETGLLGLVAYLGFILWVVRCGWRALARPSFDPLMGAVLVGCFSGVIGRLLHMGLDTFNGRSQTQALIIMAGLLVAAADVAARLERSPTNSLIPGPAVAARTPPVLVRTGVA